MSEGGGGEGGCGNGLMGRGGKKKEWGGMEPEGSGSDELAHSEGTNACMCVCVSERSIYRYMMGRSV